MIKEYFCYLSVSMYVTCMNTHKTSRRCDSNENLLNSFLMEKYTKLTKIVRQQYINVISL